MASPVRKATIAWLEIIPAFDLMKIELAIAIYQSIFQPNLQQTQYQSAL